MGITKVYIQIWISFILTSEFSLADHTYLYGAHPSGGLWGAKVDLSTGKSKTLGSIGYLGAPHEIGTVSYDAQGEQILLEYFKPHRLDHGPFCRNPPNESFPLTNVTKFPIYMNGVTDCIECQASSFAFHGNRVYFLMVGEFGPFPNVTKRVQLRVFEPCENCAFDIIHRESLQVFSTPFLFNCSTVLSEIYSTVEYPDRIVHLKAGRSMKIVARESKLEFFFQVFVGIKYHDMDHFETHLSLYHVTPTSEVVRLRTEKIHWRYAQWNIRGIASVDYMDGVLCWTAGDRLYCGELVGKELKNVQILLLPGDTVIAQVCTGSNLDLLAIVTGVAIARADTKKVIFFGCFPNWAGLGGTGMVKLESDWTEKEIVPVIDSSGVPRLAGSVFVTDVIPTFCPITELPPDICPSPPPSYSLVKDEPMIIEDNGSGLELTLIKENAVSGAKESGCSPVLANAFTITAGTLIALFAILRCQLSC